MLTDPQLADRSITSVAFDAGFGDLSYFNRVFRRRFGGTPSEIRASTPACEVASKPKSSSNMHHYSAMRFPATPKDRNFFYLDVPPRRWDAPEWTRMRAS
jgi:AraC-like DNA-binding protein